MQTLKKEADFFIQARLMANKTIGSYFCTYQTFFSYKQGTMVKEDYISYKKPLHFNMTLFKFVAVSSTILILSL